MQGSQTQSDVHLLLQLCQKHKQDKALLPIYSQPNRFEFTCIYMETMATTSESADKSVVSQVLRAER